MLQLQKQTEVKFMPRGDRSRQLQLKKVMVEPDDLLLMLHRLNDATLAVNDDLKAASFHIDLALRKIRSYNETVKQAMQ